MLPPTLRWPLLPRRVFMHPGSYQRQTSRWLQDSGSCIETLALLRIHLTVITIESKSILSHEVTGLGIFTKYEFQVLTFSLMGDGPPTSVKAVRTDVGGKYSPWAISKCYSLSYEDTIVSWCWHFSGTGISARPLVNASVSSKSASGEGNRWLLAR